MRFLIRAGVGSTPGRFSSACAILAAVFTVQAKETIQIEAVPQGATPPIAHLVINLNGTSASDQVATFPVQADGSLGPNTIPPGNCTALGNHSGVPAGDGETRFVQADRIAVCRRAKLDPFEQQPFEPQEPQDPGTGARRGGGGHGADGADGADGTPSANVGSPSVSDVDIGSATYVLTTNTATDNLRWFLVDGQGESTLLSTVEVADCPGRVPAAPRAVAIAELSGGGPSTVAIVAKGNCGEIAVYDLTVSGPGAEVTGSPFVTQSGSPVLSLALLPISGGHFLYASVPNADQIEIYTVTDADGALQHVANEPTETGVDRSVAGLDIVDDGTLVTLVAGYADSDESVISAYTVNGETGLLTPENGSPYVPFTFGLDGTYDSRTPLLDRRPNSRALWTNHQDVSHTGCIILNEDMAGFDVLGFADTGATPTGIVQVVSGSDSYVYVLDSGDLTITGFEVDDQADTLDFLGKTSLPPTSGFPTGLIAIAE